MYETNLAATHYRRSLHLQPLLYWYLASRIPFWAWLLFIGTSLFPGDSLENIASFLLVFELACLIPTGICLGSLVFIQKIARNTSDYRQWKNQMLKHVTIWPLIGGTVTFFAGVGLNFNGTNIIETLTVTATIVGAITGFVLTLNLLTTLWIIRLEKKNHPEYTGLTTNLA